MAMDVSSYAGDRDQAPCWRPRLLVDKGLRNESTKASATKSHHISCSCDQFRLWSHRDQVIQPCL
jgi:hypothetical protein